MVTCVLVWASCLYSVGVYHRHAMGDGCQLNVLLFKKRVFDIVVSLVALVGTAIITIPVAIASTTRLTLSACWSSPASPVHGKCPEGPNLSEEESEALDVNYVQNWSMLGDIVLLFWTVGAVLTHKGAY